ncbi:MAG: OmpA family protein [Turneriella sp.]|nr:OmpA family protein [Turneriella sp.]
MSLRKRFVATISIVLCLIGTPIAADVFYYPAEYKKLENDIYALSIQKSLLQSQLTKTQKEAAFEKNKLEEKVRSLESQIASLEDKLRSTDNSLRDEKRGRAEDNNENNLSLAEKERQIKTLKKQSTAKQQEMAETAAAQERAYLEEIKKLKAELERNRDEAKKQLEEVTEQKNKRIAELESALANKSHELATCLDTARQQKETVSELEKQALELEKRLEKEIAEGNLRIKRYKNRIVINIDDKILFPSGSAYLRRDVRKTLDTVADILAKNSSSRVLVEGHTDNVPIKTPRFPDNWELASARALSVLRHLLSNQALNPARFGAVGYGEYRPVAENNGSKNRQLNRRVDIVLQAADPSEEIK